MAKKEIFDPEIQRDIEAAAAWWAPKLVSWSTWFALAVLVLNSLSLALLFFSAPLPFVRVVTDSGVVTDVATK